MFTQTQRIINGTRVVINARTIIPKMKVVPQMTRPRFQSTKTKPTSRFEEDKYWMIGAGVILFGGIFYLTSPPNDFKKNTINLDGDLSKHIKSNDIVVESNSEEVVNTHSITQDLHEKADKVANNVSEAVEDKVQHAKETKDQVLETIENKVDEASSLKDKIVEEAYELKEKVTEKAGKITENIESGIHNLSEKVSETVNSGIEGVEEQASELGNSISKNIDSVKEKITILSEEESLSVALKPKVFYKYILVGGGTAAYSAMKAIKQREPDADILIVSDEPVAPYMRPPLSKELWFSEEDDVSETLDFKDWQGQKRNLVYGKPEDYEIIDADTLNASSDKRIKLLVGCPVTKLNVERKVIHLENDRRIAYGKILLATGGTPKSLPIFTNAPEEIKSNISTYRNLKDFKALEKLTKEGKHIVVIGGGFLGSELSYALANKGRKTDTKVTQIFREGGNMAAVFPTYLTAWTTKRIQEEGVNVLPGQDISKLEAAGDNKVKITLESGEQLSADHVVVAVGIQPNDKLAKQAGLDIDETRGGILVNAELESRGDVYAAGDVSSYHDIALGRRRVEHHDHAALSGRHAGENMAGPKKPYRHQSMFWSDLGPKIGYEAVGVIDSNLETSGVWVKGKEAGEDQFNKGLVFYFREEKLVGVVLWNLFNKVDIARELIRLNKFSNSHINELAAQFSLYEPAH